MDKKPMRKKKTAAELKADLEAAKKRVALLEAKAYEEELLERIRTSKILDEFNSIKADFKDVAPLTILSVIGKAVKIPRLKVTQTEPVPRKSTNKR